jgi:AcrR family transcriptional regulator
LAIETKRERRQARTREAILAAALDIVVKGGTNALSMREVARRVDYSPAALYEFFGSKEDIVAAVVAEGYQKFAAYLGQVSEELPPYERLIELGTTYVEFARSNREYYLLMFTGLAEWWYEGKPKIDDRGSYQLLVDTIAAGVEAGVFVPREGVSVDEMAYGCWAMVHGMAMLQLNQQQENQLTLKQVDREVIRIIADGLTIRR